MVHGGQAALVWNEPSRPVSDHCTETLVKLFGPPASAHEKVIPLPETRGSSNWTHGTLVAL